MASARERRGAIEKLTIKLIDHFGGISELATAWHSAHQNATDAMKLRADLALLTLLQWVEQSDPCRSDLTAMTDQELEDETRNQKIRATTELLEDHRIRGRHDLRTIWLQVGSCWRLKDES